MNFTLMHKNVSVIEIELDEVTGGITRLGALYDINHIPIGISIINNLPDRAALNKWWTGRSIPASRMGIREALETMQIASPQLLLSKCLGLSLSDQYWICPKNSDLTWSKVNFFENSFSEYVGDVLFGRTNENDDTEFSLMSPDNTSDGWLKKKWAIIDGKRCLVKSGSNPYQQEPLNEILATALCERLSIPHVAYFLTWDNDYPYSVCENFITPQTELVSAWYIMQTQKKDVATSKYEHFVDCCITLGIKDVIQKLDQIFALDFIMANEDRHLNNFGAVRNAETLEWIGIAPVYDCGTSMWCNQNTKLIAPVKHDKSKPFMDTHKEQIGLLTSLDFIDYENLKDISDVGNEIYKQSPFIDDERKNLLCFGIERRVKLLQEMAFEKSQNQDSGMTML